MLARTCTNKLFVSQFIIDQIYKNLSDAELVSARLPSIHPHRLWCVHEFDNVMSIWLNWMSRDGKEKQQQKQKQVEKFFLFSFGEGFNQGKQSSLSWVKGQRKMKWELISFKNKIKDFVTAAGARVLLRLTLNNIENKQIYRVGNNELGVGNLPLLSVSRSSLRPFIAFVVWLTGRLIDWQFLSGNCVMDRWAVYTLFRAAEFQKISNNKQPDNGSEFIFCLTMSENY